MKKLLLFLIIAFIAGFAKSQTLNYEMKFRFNNKDTLLDKAKIFLWNGIGTFPGNLEWKNSPFCLKPVGDKIGLFTNSTHSFTSGQDVGLAFIKVASTGYFMNDYYQSNIGLMVNDSDTPNVEIYATSQGLMMRALTSIPSNTEIILKYSSIVTMYPHDITVKMMIHK